MIVKALLEFKEVEMIILFGSYATNDYVHSDRYKQNGIIYEYKSDYDLLIILSKNKQASNSQYIFSITKTLNKLKFLTPISPIYEGEKFVNQQLSESSYFFTEIKIKGILLYNFKRKQLVRKRKLSLGEIKKQTQDYFDEWFKSANMFFEDYIYNFKKGKKDSDYFKKAIFELHQATELYYHTLTLVFTGYKHKPHDMEELEEFASTLNLEFKKIFPRHTEEEEYLFSLLQKVYIKKRDFNCRSFRRKNS